MMKFRYILTLVTMVMTMTIAEVCAQGLTIVTGHVYNKETKLPFNLDFQPRIFYFDKASEGDSFFNMLLNNPKSAEGMTAKSVFSNDEGYYAIIEGVDVEGVLIFYVSGSTPVKEYVKNQNKIDCYIQPGIEIKEVEVVNVRPDRPVQITPVVVDKWIRLHDTIPVPEGMDHADFRMIFQPYLVEYYTREDYDTIEWANPIVADGGEFRATQRRRMGFNLRRDSLFRFFSKGTIKNPKYVVWNDSLEMPDPNNGRYRVKGITNIENYGGTIYNDNYVIVQGMRRPLKYLDYACATVDIDITNPLKRKFVKKDPEIEIHRQDKQLSLTFKYASADLDPTNPQNEVELNALLTSLDDVMRTSGAQIQSLKFIGVSSPDGSYQYNMSLSKQRIQTVKNNIVRRCSIQLRAIDEATVAPWDSVVPLLYNAGYPDVAKEVAQICSRTQDPDLRYQQVSRLSQYKTVVESVLPKLRKVTCQCNFQLYREPSDDEILHNYRTNPAFREGKRVTLYEYSRLFDLLKDSVGWREMEGLYKRALESSKRSSSKPWHLPANLLAKSYIKRDTVDLNVLRGFVDFKGNLNLVDGRNIDEIWVNQMIMYIKDNKTDTARTMAEIMRNETNVNKLGKDAYQLQWALAHKDKFQSNSEVYAAIAESSARNYVVMNLAMKDNPHDLKAKARWDELDKDEAVTWYLKAVLEGRLDPQVLNDDGPDALLKAWELDESFYETAEFDADIIMDMVSYARGAWLAKQKAQKKTD